MNNNTLVICKRLQDAGHQAFIVGGAVRDLLMNKVPKDFDIATSASPAAVKKIFSDFPVTGVGEAFGIVVVVIDGEPFEIAQFRQDIGGDGRHPEEVKAANSITADLSRRDFTINAMALDPLSGELVDPFGGKEDIANKVIRFVGNAQERIAEDHLRILRAFRFQSTLGFNLERFDIGPNALEGISQERITTEFKKIVAGDNACTVIDEFVRNGLLFQIVPETKALMEPHNSPWHLETGEFGTSIMTHVLRVFKEAVRLSEEMDFQKRVILRMAALFHDIAKPLCRKVKSEGHDSFHLHDLEGLKLSRTILTRMRFTSDEVNIISDIVKKHMAIHDIVKIKKIHKARRLLGRPNIGMIIRLAICDTLGTEGIDCPQPALVNMEVAIADWKSKYPVMLPPPLITGDDLIKAGLKPGPEFKRRLDIAYDQQLIGETNSAKLLKFALGAKIG